MNGRRQRKEHALRVDSFFLASFWFSCGRERTTQMALRPSSPAAGGFRWQDTVYNQALRREGRENISRTMVAGIFGETGFRRASRLTEARYSRTIARPTSEEVPLT
jgi:hypothetical protein